MANHPAYDATDVRLLRGLMEQHYRTMIPPSRRRVSEWAESTRRLSQEASAELGLWRNRPFQAEILDILGPESPYQQIVLMMASQSFKTETLLNFLGYVIDMDPGPALLVEPREVDAKAISKDRVGPMIRDTPELRAKVGSGKNGKSAGDTTLHKSFLHGHISFAGANSPSGLAMRPIRYLMLDEVDRYPITAGREGDPCMLAMRRTDEFAWNKKIILCSSPTTEGESRIASAYEDSDQRRPEVPCPFCGEFQELRFPNLKWQKGEPDSVEYECGFCAKRIPHHKKGWMLHEGKWRVTRPQSSIAGFWFSQLYSVKRTWADVVREFLIAEKSSETLRVFTNTVLAETWRERGEVPDWKRLYERADDYPLHRVPKGGLLLTAGVDCQEDRLEVQVVAWGKREESWLVDYIVIEGSVRLMESYRNAEGEVRPSVWQRLEEVLRRKWPHVGGEEMGLSQLAIDSGWATQEVYSWVRRVASPVVMCVRGDDRYKERVASRPVYCDVNYAGKQIVRGVKLWPLNVSSLKDAFYGQLKLEKPTRESGEPFPVGYCHYPKMNEDFFRQLTAEQLETSVNRAGYRVRKWTKHGRNEALDTRIYARAAAIRLGIERYGDKHWDRLERQLGLRKPEDQESQESTRAAIAASAVAIPSAVVSVPPATVSPAQQRALQQQKQRGRVQPPTWHVGGSPW